MNLYKPQSFTVVFLHSPLVVHSPRIPRAGLEPHLEFPRDSRNSLGIQLLSLLTWYLLARLTSLLLCGVDQDPRVLDLEFGLRWY